MSCEIKLFVSCHKLSVLPECKLFVPIHVGAAISDKQMNMLRDDTGDNISSKTETIVNLLHNIGPGKMLMLIILDFSIIADFFVFKYLRKQLKETNETMLFVSI